MQHSIWSQGIPNNKEENARYTSSAPSPLTADPRTPSKNFPAIYTFLEIKPASTSYKLEFLISVPVRGCRPPVIGSILFCPRQPSLASSKQSLFNTDHQLQLPIGFVLEMHSVIRLKSQLVQFARFVIDQQWLVINKTYSFALLDFSRSRKFSCQCGKMSSIMRDDTFRPDRSSFSSKSHYGLLSPFLSLVNSDTHTGRK